jgi:serine/threonine protein phosphatase PrpC
MFGVFDGHGGHYVAAELQLRYAETFAELLHTYEQSHAYKSHGHSYVKHIEQVFSDTCAALDLDILQKDFARQQKNLHSGVKDLQTYAGSVGVTVAVMPVLSGTSNKIEVFVSHVGDCRAVLSNSGIAVQLTEDHKANLAAEKARIEAAGGYESKGRVNGVLGVSRSIGDIQFKNFNDAMRSAYGEDGKSGIWSDNQQVISKPDFKHFVVESNHEFLILASDGLWDVFTCQEAVNFVRMQLLTCKDLNKAAEAIIKKALSRGTQDNTSVVIVAFHQFE